MTITATGAVRISELNTECINAVSANSSLKSNKFDCLRGSSAIPVAMTAFYSKTNNDITSSASGADTGYKIIPAAATVGLCTSRVTLGITLFRFYSSPGLFHIDFVGNLSQNSWTKCTFVRQDTLGAFTTLNSAAATGFGYDTALDATGWAFTVAPPALVNGIRYLVSFT